MNIYHFSNARIPTEKAHGIQIMHMANAFASLGHKVTVIVPERPNAISEDPFLYYSLAKTFSIVFLPAISSQLSRAFGRFSYFLLQISFAWSAYRYAKKYSADVYYHRDEYTFFLFTLLGIHSIYEMHTIPTHLGAYLPFLRRAKGIVVVSNGIRDQLLKSGVHTNILVAPAGVDLSLFEHTPSQKDARALCDFPQDKILVMYTGQLFAWKGVDTLVEAAAYLPETVEIVFVGGGGAREEELKKKAEGSAAFVRFVGQIKHERIPQYLAAADIIAIPNSAIGTESISYTSPLKLAEALASGKAIVASDLPSLREVLDESCARFFQPDDPQALAQQIALLANDSEKRIALGKRGKERSHSRDWKSRAQKILSTFIV